MRTVYELLRDRYWVILAELLFTLCRVAVTWWEAWFERTHPGTG